MTGATVVLASIGTPSQLADWLAGNPNPAEKVAMHGALVDQLGYEATVALWTAGHERHRRARSTCRASLEAWTIPADVARDSDGKVTCPVCRGQVPVTVDRLLAGLVVIDAHDVEEVAI